MNQINFITFGRLAAHLPHFPCSAVMRHRTSLATRLPTVEGARAGAAANRRGLVPRTLPIQ